MGQIVKGVIQAVESKQVSGGRQAWDIVVAGQRYGVGLYKPKANEGDYVQFEVDDSRGYLNVARNTLRALPGKPPAEEVQVAQATAPARTTSGAVVTKGDTDRAKRDEERQETISRQSALNSAIDFLKVAQAADALGLPASGPKGKKLEALEAVLDKYTQLFYTQSTGKEWKTYDRPASPHTDTIEDQVAQDSQEIDDAPWT